MYLEIPVILLVNDQCPEALCQCSTEIPRLILNATKIVSRVVWLLKGASKKCEVSLFSNMVEMLTPERLNAVHRERSPLLSYGTRTLFKSLEGFITVNPVVEALSGFWHCSSQILLP